MKTILLNILSLMWIMNSPKQLFAATCPVGESEGSSRLGNTIAPNAWDGVFIDEVIVGNNRHSVDWCGWVHVKGKECEVNCRGESPSFGTKFVDNSSAKPCAPESAKIYRWICNDCRIAYNQKKSECDALDKFLYWITKPVLVNVK